MITKVDCIRPDICISLRIIALQNYYRKTEETLNLIEHHIFDYSLTEIGDGPNINVSGPSIKPDIP